MNQHQLNQDELLRISRAISDTTRYALLETIYFDQQITVGELCVESTVSAATVAHHIKILNDAHLTGGAKDYDPRVFDILRCGCCGGRTSGRGDRHHLWVPDRVEQ